MTNLKYETDRRGDFISLISGKDLCSSILDMKIMVSVILIYFLLHHNNKIIKKQKP